MCAWVWDVCVCARARVIRKALFWKNCKYTSQGPWTHREFDGGLVCFTGERQRLISYLPAVRKARPSLVRIAMVFAKPVLALPAGDLGRLQLK